LSLIWPPNLPIKRDRLRRGNRGDFSGFGCRVVSLWASRWSAYQTRAMICCMHYRHDKNEYAMNTTLLSRFVHDVHHVKEHVDTPFTQSYFAFLPYCNELPVIKPQDIIISSYFTYGWMPTVLRLKNTNFEAAADILH
jgi:hypothetical protein